MNICNHSTYRPMENDPDREYCTICGNVRLLKLPPAFDPFAMTTPATITTEELDALAALEKAATECRCSIVPCDHMHLFRRRLEANCSRLIEQARKWIEAESQDYNPDQHAYGLMWQERNKEAMRAICAESALSATRERLEIAVAWIKSQRHYGCQGTMCDSDLDPQGALSCIRAAKILSRISAIAAKAGTGGKGEAEKQNETEK